MALFENEAGLFSRRLFVLCATQASLFALLAGRLQYLQVSQSANYETLAEANRVNISQLTPARGLITDRQGTLLADNDRKLLVELVPEQIRDLDGTLAELQEHLGLSNGRLRELRRKIKRGPSFKAITVAEDVDWDAFAAINLRLPFLPGVAPRTGEKRIYPEGETLAHVVGYVGDKTAADLRRMGRIVGDTVGRSGVEREFERDLRGTAGVRHVEVNARGRNVRELETTPGKPGQNITLSIDVALQRKLSERLNGHSGSAVVMDIETGELLAMASVPSFDPNGFSRGVEASTWEKMLVAERKPLMNKAIRGQYSPGSTFKMLVALAALEEKLVAPEDEINCSGVYPFSGEKFHCWRPEGHGQVNMVQAIERSCDSYFYDLALKVGINRIEAMARRFGLGAATGINLLGEKNGTIPGRDWKRANYDTGWRAGETVITGIGQGYLLTTPLQLVVMTAALANGGKLVTPTLLAGQSAQAQPRPIGVAPEHLAIVQQGMYRAVNKPDGTAYASSLLIGNQRMSGKTGTVQVRRISLTEREEGVIPNSELDWHLRDHALFVGYVPHRAPRYAISVVIEHGGGGGQVAAPIARDIMVDLLRSQETPPPPATPTPKAAASANPGESS
jgi:penicillin-binding protein 2